VEGQLVAQRHEVLRERIRALTAEHPFWGDRRIWASLHFVEQLSMNKKRILRLMREHYLLVMPNPRLKAKRTPTGRQPRPTKPNEWWGIDMIKVLVEGFGWIHIVVVLDWYTKKIVGDYAGMACKAQHWLSALDMAANVQFPDGVRGKGLSLMRDNGGQPTSTAFMRACGTLGIWQAFTSDNNPKGNADTERLMRTRKEECLWLQEWTCPFRLIGALDSWIADYHAHYLHSSLGYMSPRKFEQADYDSHSTPFVAA
jgi:transposase InsO family protein